MAIAVDPLNVIWRIELAGILFQAEQYDESLQETLKAAEINEDHWATQIALGINYLEKRLLDRSITAFERALNQAPLVAQLIGHLAGTAALRGDSTRAAGLIRRLREGPSHSVPIGMAIYHAICQEPEAAAEWFERAIELHDPAVLQYAREPTTARVFRRSSRWRELLNKMNLP